MPISFYKKDDLPSLIVLHYTPSFLPQENLSLKSIFILELHPLERKINQCSTWNIAFLAGLNQYTSRFIPYKDKGFDLHCRDKGVSLSVVSKLLENLRQLSPSISSISYQIL